MTKIISMINWKGGVGKTTLTMHIGIGLQNLIQPAKVLIVDLDPQCNLSFLSLGVDSYVDKVYEKEVGTLKTAFDNYFNDNPTNALDLIQSRVVNSSPGYVYTGVDMILSHQELVLLDLQLARNKKAGKDHIEETKFEIEKLSILKNLLDSVKDNYDYILLDCPPNVNIVTQNAFYASDYYVIPTIPDFLSTTGISLIKNYMEQFNNNYIGMHTYTNSPEYKPTEFGGIIFNRVDEYSEEPKASQKETIANIISQNQNKVFENYLTGGDGISASSLVNLPVYAHNDLPRAKSNAEKQSDYLNKICQEFIQKIN